MNPLLSQASKVLRFRAFSAEFAPGDGQKWGGYNGRMADVTQILSRIEHGDPTAAEQLLPLVYDELRKLAAARMAHEKPGQTLQATALVHEAYLKLVDVERAQQWDSRGHFFAAAAEAMRRILIERHRQKNAEKRGGGMNQLNLHDADLGAKCPSMDILALNDAIELLSDQDPTAGEIAKLRIFCGLTVDEAGKVLGLAHTTAYRQWAYAQAWLRAKLVDPP